MTIPQYCIQISELLKESDSSWSHLFNWFANQYVLDQNDTLTKIRHQYGGMGSFSDLVLYKDGIFERERMEKLDYLRNALYEALVAEIIKLRSQ
jgi:hypothetical protein